MTPAELKTIRESLGISAQWLADQTGVRLRTVQYWESGERLSIPDDVQKLIWQLENQANAFVDKSLDVIEERLENGDDVGLVVLIRYKSDRQLWEYHPALYPITVTCHSARIYRLYRELRQLEVDVHIVYLDEEQYRAWLGERVNSAEMRSLWAASML